MIFQCIGHHELQGNDTAFWRNRLPPFMPQVKSGYSSKILLTLYTEEHDVNIYHHRDLTSIVIYPHVIS